MEWAPHVDVSGIRTGSRERNSILQHGDAALASPDTSSSQSIGIGVGHMHVLGWDGRLKSHPGILTRQQSNHQCRNRSRVREGGGK